MKKALCLLALLAGTAAPLPARPAPAPQTGDSARYVCADGRAVEVLYGGGVAVVTIGGATIELKRAPAADGERYVGGGWQWWAQGKRKGALAPLAPGQDAAPAGVSCHA